MNSAFIPFPVFVFITLAASCGPPIEDHVEQLGDGSGEALIKPRQELLLARVKAVPPLLEALEDPRRSAARPEIASVLVDLMTRLEDERIAPALQRHLLTDPDPRVRTRISFDVGFYERVEFADAFLEALHDTVGQVRAHAMTALARMQSKLSIAQRDSLIEAARLMQNEESEEARLEAAFVVADHVKGWLREGGKRRLEGMIAEAESLYCEALAYAPGSKKASHELGTLYLENGQDERGLQVLRESGWLVDVTRVTETPRIDGRLNDEVWARPAGSVPFTSIRADPARLSNRNTLPWSSSSTRMRPSTLVCAARTRTPIASSSAAASTTTRPTRTRISSRSSSIRNSIAKASSRSPSTAPPPSSTPSGDPIGFGILPGTP